VEANQPFTGTILLANATLASIANLPTWASVVTTPQGSGLLMTITGTPPSAQVINFLVDATNATPGGRAASLDDASGGALTVTAPNVCPPPVVIATLSPTSAQVGTPYAGVILTTNATAATIPTLPGWATQVFTAATQQLTITGTPTTSLTLPMSVNLSNVCAGGVPAQMIGAPAGLLTIAPLANCPTPTISQPLTPSAAQENVPYAGSIVVNNANSVVLTAFDPWMQISYVQQGAQMRITITGTPTTTASLALAVRAISSCAGGTPVTVNNLYGGIAAVCPKPSLGDQLANCAGVPVGVMLVPQTCDQRTYIEITDCNNIVLGYAHPTQTTEFTNPVEVCGPTGNVVMGWIYPA
jgi:hypothetical protein